MLNNYDSFAFTILNVKFFELLLPPICLSPENSALATVTVVVMNSDSFYAEICISKLYAAHDISYYWNIQLQVISSAAQPEAQYLALLQVSICE